MVRVAAVAIAFTVITVALIPVQWAALKLRLPLRRRIPVVYHRLMCRLLGVRIHSVGAPYREGPVLIAANHVSWLDIPVLTAVAPVVFVAKREVAGWPLIGLLAKLQRSVFVDRERRHQTAEANREIAERLAEGDPVILFAEGTSDDGNRVLPFRSSLIGAVHDAMRPAEAGQGRDIFVQPLALAYIGLNGFPAGMQHRPKLAWYGDMSLGPHLLGVVRSGAIDVTVTWGEPIKCAAGVDRKAVARSLENSVRSLASAARRPGP
jgi:1-acyl-sn-glycerol-3-phosphate acyltransferase